MHKSFFVLWLVIGVLPGCAQWAGLSRHDAGSDASQLTETDRFLCQYDQARVDAVKAKLAAVKGLVVRGGGAWSEEDVDLVYKTLSSIPDVYLDHLVAMNKSHGFHIGPAHMGAAGTTEKGGSPAWEEYTKEILIGLPAKKHVTTSLLHEAFHAIEPFIIKEAARKSGRPPAQVYAEFEREMAVAVKEIKGHPRIWYYPSTVNFNRYTEFLPEVADNFYCSAPSKEWLKNLHKDIKKPGAGNGSSVTYAFAEKYFEPPVFEPAGATPPPSATAGIFIHTLAADSSGELLRALIAADPTVDSVSLCRGDEAACKAKPESVVEFAVNKETPSRKFFYTSRDFSLASAAQDTPWTLVGMTKGVVAQTAPVFFRIK